MLQSTMHGIAVNAPRTTTSRRLGFYMRGLPYMTKGPKEQNQLICDNERGGKSEHFPDVIYGSPLNCRLRIEKPDAPHDFPSIPDET